MDETQNQQQGQAMYMYVVYSHVTEEPCGLFPCMEAAKSAANDYTSAKGDFCSLYKIAPGHACACVGRVWSNDAPASP